jgi:two-component system sensor histidine kinase YesM
MDRLRTVKGQVIILMVFFALIVTILVMAFSLYMMYAFQRRTAVQSAEFNLQLVASVIEQDMRDLAALGRWCGQNAQITGYFLSQNQNNSHLMDAWYRMLEEFHNNRSGRYVRRLIVIDTPTRKLLQVGNSTDNSEPVTVYNVRKIFDMELTNETGWQDLILDPFFIKYNILVIPFVCPVYNPSDSSEIGTVILAAAISLITDKFNGYNLPENSELYLNLNGSYYRIEGNEFIPTEYFSEILGYNIHDPVSPNTTAMVVRDKTGRRRTLVSYPVRDGIALSQVLSSGHFFPGREAWPALTAGLCFLILLLALIITLSLDMGISRPVARLRKKIDAISGGDFSLDPDIESDNELGQVGHGINRMAQEITALLDKRVADEKNKRDLEYRMLQSQINPHFLYNTLNSIKWMASIQNAQGIVEMTTALSRLLQTISRDIRKMVPLKDELALLDDYLIIQKYRYGDSVTLIKKIEDKELLRVLIPRFVLQPLVENAIFHGIEPKGAGVITLETVQKAGDVLVSITDDGVGMSADTIAKLYFSSAGKPGMFRELGVHNVDERLRYAFGGEYGLSIASEEGKYTTITIRLPHQKEEDGD